MIYLCICTSHCLLRVNDGGITSDQVYGNGNFPLLRVIQEDQLDDGWSPVISDYDRVTNPKALREALVSTDFLHR